MNDDDVSAELTGKEREVLDSLLREVRSEDVELYMEKAEEHVRECEEASAAGKEVNVDLARRIFSVLDEISASWDDLSAKHQLLVCAAARYFARTYDEISDLDSEIGLDDDAEVLNACLIALGRKDLLIEL